jgi:hypothetical protein
VSRTTTSAVPPRAQVQRGERKVGRIRVENLHGVPARLLDALRFSRAQREPAQCIEAAFADDTGGRFEDRGEDPSYAAALVEDRAVGEREVTLLEEAVAVHHEELIVRPRGLPLVADLVEHRPDDRPDLRPHVAAARAEGAGVAPRIVA